jgi:pimeloyl-ACP methyl ester carboxylesterase
VPVGCSIFPKEIFRTSRRWAEKRFPKLMHFNELERGGHFAAFEQPETFVREVRECFRKLR